MSYLRLITHPLLQVWQTAGNGSRLVFITANDNAEDE